MDERVTRLTAEEPLIRLDKYIAGSTGLSRSGVQNAIAEGRVLVNGGRVTAKYIPKAGDDITVFEQEPRELSAEPEDIPIDIVYEDRSLAVINKQKGLVVHPCAGTPSGTLVNALLFHLDGLSGINGVLRPGIVHRLDKDTTGLLVVAKTDAAHRALAEQIKQKTARRIYYALVNGRLKQPKGEINAPIARHPFDRKRMAVVKDGRDAVTQYEVLEELKSVSFIRLELKTGRTHQIRVHMAHIGHSVMGDEVYGRVPCKYETHGQALHAGELSFTHPETGEQLIFKAPLPQYMQDILKSLREQ